ncbi:hypothetical protein ACFXD5_21690 [Streptomyces sp. NPDC059385]|uniref:hypothetical protein n=1 Tax=Streptomyces sp. NPDC059385 TaxID=3346817 RepID=UPI0036B87708
MPTASSRSADSEPAKPLPHFRVPVNRQIAIIKTLGSMPQPCHVRDIQEHTSIGSWQVGIAMKFLLDCGLAERVPPRGTYRATKKGVDVARAWSVGPDEGRRALHDAWKGLWFVRSARERLADGAGLRAGLRLQFLRQVKTAGHEQGVDRLLDLMTATGFLVEESDGYVRWHADAAEPAFRTEHGQLNAHTEPQQADTRQDIPAAGEESAASVADASSANHTGYESGAGQDELCSDDRENEHAESNLGVPGPRRAAESSSGQPYGDDGAGNLLAGQLDLGDVCHLTPEEAAALHDHLTGLLATLSAMRTRLLQHGDVLNAALLTPWNLADIAAMDRAEWLNTHHLASQMSTAAPLRRQPTNV